MKTLLLILSCLIFAPGCALFDKPFDTVDLEDVFVAWSLDLGAMLVVVTPDIKKEYALVDDFGLFVFRLESGNSGEHGGLKACDLILEINHLSVFDKKSFCRALEHAYQKSKFVDFKVRRGFELVNLCIQLP